MSGASVILFRGTYRSSDKTRRRPSATRSRRVEPRLTAAIFARYPEGVSVQEGEDWYVNVHAKEVINQPDLKRYFSFSVIEPKVGPFVRVSELWCENANAWRLAILEAPPDDFARYLRPYLTTA